LTDVTSETLRLWRQSQGWDVPRMARELRKAARDSGEDVAAHHGLVKMIPQWERGNRAEIRALAEEAIAHLHEVTAKLTELSALLGDDQAGEGKP
jgi:transcriptional regulator with XRE-family HTH domain